MCYSKGVVASILSCDSNPHSLSDFNYSHAVRDIFVVFTRVGIWLVLNLSGKVSEIFDTQVPSSVI